MYDPTITPPPLIPPVTQKHSRIGIASFVIGIVAVLILCLAFLLAFGYGFSMVSQNPTFQVDQSSPTVLALGVLMCISPILSLVGLGLGIGAVVQKNYKKLFGIIGLVLNLLIILFFFVLFVIGMSGQFGSLSL
jgi:hypothetical protein